MGEARRYRRPTRREREREREKAESERRYTEAIRALLEEELRRNPIAPFSDWNKWPEAADG